MKVDYVKHVGGEERIEIQILEGSPVYSLTIMQAEMLSVMLMETIPLASDPFSSEEEREEHDRPSPPPL